MKVLWLFLIVSINLCAEMKLVDADFIDKEKQAQYLKEAEEQNDPQPKKLEPLTKKSESKGLGGIMSSSKDKNPFDTKEKDPFSAYGSNSKKSSSSSGSSSSKYSRSSSSSSKYNKGTSSYY